MRKVGSEEDITFQLANHMRRHHAHVLYHFDFGSGIKLTQGQAMKQKRLNNRGWPDFTIANSKFVAGSIDVFGSLYLEIKKLGTKLKREKAARKVLKGENRQRRKGDWWDAHMEEQAHVLEMLRDQGNYAEFGVGLDECLYYVHEYVGYCDEASSTF
jgi:hypothetical protein